MPRARLYQEDRSHPTSLGTYVAACVFYGTLLDRSPEGIDLQQAGIKSSHALVIQRVAWRAVREHR